MPYNIRIKAGEIELKGTLNDSPTAELIWAKLPIESSGNLWGDEIYFSIPVLSELDEASQDKVNIGDLAYWPLGKAFCIFFGPTPLTTEGEIIPAGKVTIVGQITDNPKKLKFYEEGDFITISRKSN